MSETWEKLDHKPQIVFDVFFIQNLLTAIIIKPLSVNLKCRFNKVSIDVFFITVLQSKSHSTGL
jgi:hypothetical protein